MAPLDVLLENTGPPGVFLRFVRRFTGRDDLFAVRGRSVVGSGMAAGIFVARAHWLFAPDADDGDALLADVLPVASAVYQVGHDARPEGWNRTIDLVFLGDGRPSDVRILTGDEFLGAELDPELAPRVAPPQIRARLPFRFHGLEHDGRIVAMCDTTVDDGDHVVVQQVHTVERLRGRGLATTLLGGVLGFAHGLGRRVVYLCDEQNPASAALARTVGLSLHAEVPLLTRRSAGQ